MKSTILSIQIGKPRQQVATDPHDKPWTTGFFKQPVGGPVWVGRLNIEGDGQADLENHGGPDKAVLAYSADHFADWIAELGQQVPDAKSDSLCGSFGENLSIAGLTETDVCIGDIWQAGDVRFQISQPRQPCWKLGRRWRRADLPKRVVQSGRTGWYLRVLDEGTLSPGDELTLLERPQPD